jgi:arginyl-tRNA synthetase
MSLFHVDVAHLLAPHLSLTVREVVAELTTPPDPTLGDVAFPCFALAKAWRQAPQAIAAALASRLPVVAPVVRITAVGPYLNIHLDRALATT